MIVYDWNCLTADVGQLAKMVKPFDPTLIVGILRGGAVPAVMLSHRLNVPLKMLQWSTRDFASRDFSGFVDGILRPAIRNNDRVLIVDDILDSGVTIGELQHYAKKMVCNDFDEWPNVKFAVLWKNVACPVPVDYSVVEIDRTKDDRWVLFPYEVSSETA